MKSAILAVLLISLFARAEMKSAKALSTKLQENEFSSQLQSGFHFNEKAPNSVKIDGLNVKPAKLDKQTIRFKLPKKKWQEAEASLYVCDDAQTFCETHNIALAGNSALSEKTLKKSTAYEQALEHAKKTGAPIFLEFGARWCPGCVRYEKEVFPTPAFKKLKKDLIFVQIDVDLFADSSIAKRYNVAGIPAIVVINADELEIDRLMDFQPLERLTEFVQSVRETPVPTNVLTLRAGKRLLEAGRYTESAQVLGSLPTAPPELLTAKIGAAEELFKKDPKQKESFAKSLREAVASEPDSVRAIGWRVELIKMDPKSREAKKLLAEGQEKIQMMMNDPEKLKSGFANESVGEFLGFEKMLLGEIQIDLLETAGAPAAEIDKAWSQAVEAGKSYRISPKQAGPGLRYLIHLSAAKHFEEADKWSQELLKQNPHNLDVLRRRMRIMMGLNKPEEAAKIGESIITDSEGRNQFWVAESLAKAYVAQQKTDDAKKLLQAYLARNEVNADNMKSSRKSLEEMLASLNEKK